MKLAVAPQDVQFSEDFEQRDVAVGDMSWILDLLADKIYTHKERAVVRELSCNAHDSHVKALEVGTLKEDRPFDVHLPTTLEPWFLIRDYGIGLEDDDIANVYGGIGISTKRDSDDFIGCMGIGSLSVYSLVDSFTVKSYFNGEVRTYQCMRDEKRNPKVIPLSIAETDEPNGLEVKFSVENNFYKFEDEAIHVFSFWDGVLPNINNSKVVDRCKQAIDNYVFKGDNFGLSTSWGEMRAIMGNVSYQIPYELDEFHCDGYLKFNIGELDFDTSRENLEVTDKVCKAIKEKSAEVKAGLLDVAIKQIESKPTEFERAQVAEKLSKGRISSFIGAKKLDQYRLPTPTDSVVVFSSNHRGSEQNSTKLITAKDKDSAGYYIAKPRMTARIKSYLKNKPSGYQLYIFNDLKQALECKIPSDLLCDLDDLPKVVRSSSSSRKKIKKESVFQFIGYNRYSDSCWTEHELDTSSQDEVVYVEINRWKVVSTGSTYALRDNYQLNRAINSISKFTSNQIDVVGLKSAFVNSSKIKGCNFIHFEDYIIREFKKIAPKVNNCVDDTDIEMISSLNRYITSEEIDGLVDLINKNKNDKLIIDEIERLSLFSIDSIATNNSDQDYVDKFFEKYFMLKTMEDYRVRDNKELIAKYIGGTVK